MCIRDRYGLALIAYEAGQHLVGVGGGENNDALTALFHQANADPRMGELYQAYLRGWQELSLIHISIGGTLSVPRFDDAGGR